MSSRAGEDGFQVYPRAARSLQLHRGCLVTAQVGPGHCGDRLFQRRLSAPLVHCQLRFPFSGAKIEGPLPTLAAGNDSSLRGSSFCGCGWRREAAHRLWIARGVAIGDGDDLGWGNGVGSWSPEGYRANERFADTPFPLGRSPGQPPSPWHRGLGSSSSGHPVYAASPVWGGNPLGDDVGGSGSATLAVSRPGFL